MRIEPNLPVNAYKTFSIITPEATHTEVVSCDEVDCGPYERGWKTVVDESTDLGQRQAAYIRSRSGRKFVEQHNEAGLTQFDFEAGQKCFTEHRIQVRPEIYLARDGDWRGNPTGRRTMHTPETWIEDFQENQQRIIEAHERG